MINVKYDRKKICVTVEGHAQTGEKGTDLVCAAASILVYTLASDVSALHAGSKRRVRRPVCILEEGKAKISCAPVHGMENVTRLIFDSVCRGFEVLAQRYPLAVRYEIS